MTVGDDFRFHAIHVENAENTWNLNYLATAIISGTLDFKTFISWRELCMDSPNKLQKYISTKVFITQPFFELLTSDFAWKFIWTVEPNDKVQKYKNTKIQKYKVQKKMYKIQKCKKCKYTKKCKECKKFKKHKKYKNKTTLGRQLIV